MLKPVQFWLNPECCGWLIWPIQNDVKKPEICRNPGKWVLIWEYSARAIQWIPTWQCLDVFQKSLHSCALNESSVSIGRVKLQWIVVDNYSRARLASDQAPVSSVKTAINAEGRSLKHKEFFSENDRDPQCNHDDGIIENGNKITVYSYKVTRSLEWDFWP